jgi:hypothetical protein
MKFIIYIIYIVYILYIIYIIYILNVYIMGTSFTKFRLFFHKVSFVFNTFFSSLCEALCADYVKLFTQASELFTHAMLQHVIIHKMASSDCIPQEAK